MGRYWKHLLGTVGLAASVSGCAVTGPGLLGSGQGERPSLAARWSAWRNPGSTPVFGTDTGSADPAAAAAAAVAATPAGGGDAQASAAKPETPSTSPAPATSRLRAAGLAGQVPDTCRAGTSPCSTAWGVTARRPVPTCSSLPTGTSGPKRHGPGSGNRCSSPGRTPAVLRRRCCAGRRRSVAGPWRRTPFGRGHDGLAGVLANRPGPAGRPPACGIRSRRAGRERRPRDPGRAAGRRRPHDARLGDPREHSTRATHDRTERRAGRGDRRAGRRPPRIGRRRARPGGRRGVGTRPPRSGDGRTRDEDGGRRTRIERSGDRGGGAAHPPDRDRDDRAPVLSASETSPPPPDAASAERPSRRHRRPPRRRIRTRIP